jgi:hypothetical protein
LRKALSDATGTRQTQTNVAKIVKRLAARRFVSTERAPDGSTWYGITIAGRVAESTLSDTPEPAIRKPRYSQGVVEIRAFRQARATKIFEPVDLSDPRDRDLALPTDDRELASSDV